MRHRFPCSDPECTFCEGRAEARAEAEYDDGHAAEEAYEAYLDRLGES